MTKVLLKTKSEFLRKNKEDIWKPCEKNKQKIKNHIKPWIQTHEKNKPKKYKLDK